MKPAFYAFLQWQAHLQFEKAVKQVEKMGISLKGDIPIMINDDSADVWAHPELFDIELRAGSPPDGLNPEGQNWGFPIYNWEEHRTNQIPLVEAEAQAGGPILPQLPDRPCLGFFRIWATPENNTSGLLGYLPSQRRLQPAGAGRAWLGRWSNPLDDPSPCPRLGAQG
jgi:4-alpha-glucanotransferase